jgi:hypothetical protein
MADSLLSQFAAFMKECNWVFTVDEEKSTIICWSTNEVASLRVLIMVKEQQKHVICTISWEMRCPRECRRNMVRLCTQLNYDLSLGFFAIDEQDGEVRYRHSVDVEGLELSAAFVANFLNGSVTNARKYYLTVDRVLHGATVEDALRFCIR